jgi:molecular chaperone DnaJ
MRSFGKFQGVLRGPWGLKGVQEALRGRKSIIFIGVNGNESWEMSLDPYKTLGIDKKASGDEIKSAYRKLAVQYHPDKNPGDKKAEEKFKELSEAYDILSDPKKKQAYDSMGSETFYRQGTDGGGYKPPDFSAGMPPEWEDIINSLFGNISFGKGGGFGGDPFDINFGSGRKKGKSGGKAKNFGSKRGENLEYTLPVTFKDAALGTKVTVTLDLPKSCSSCGGQGLSVSGGGGVQECPDCGGQGTVLVPREFTTTVPAGTEDGGRLRIKGFGAPGELGGPPGDLILVIKVNPDPDFKRVKNDLCLEKKISVYTALTGGNVEVRDLTGRSSFKIKPGTQNGTKMRLKGKGVHPAKGKAGDMIVTFRVVLPTDISAEAMELVKKLETLAPVEDTALK